MPEKREVYDYFIRGLAEFLANSIVMSLGCMGAIANDKYPNSAIQMGLAFGTMVMAAYQTFWIISGSHINPAVTIAGVIMGQINWIHLLIYIPCQLLGSFAGYYLAVAAVPHSAHYSSFIDHNFCVTIPNKAMGVKEYQAFGIEFFATSAWVFVMLSVWSKLNIGNNDAPALHLGLAILSITTLAMELTGASMNPFRTLPPALYNGEYSGIWIYFAAPLSASLLIPLVWKYFFDEERLQKWTRKGGDSQNA